MATVIVREGSYDFQKLRDLISEFMDRLAGGKVKRGDMVVVKPNFLSPAPPEKAMLTHPLILRAVAEYLIDLGTEVQISDSPAMGSFDKVLKEGGFREALQGLDVRLRPFKETTTVDVGEPFGSIEIARDVMEADHVINLPKLKTHTQMLLTLGVKNLFGCIVGMKKPEWHLRAGVDRNLFARLLFKIYRAVSPTITIMDGILAMEGQGPGKSGTPIRLGVLLASTDAVALDTAVCRMINLEPLQLLTNVAAKEEGAFDPSPEIEGVLPQVKGFRLPDVGPVIFGPERFHGFMRRHLVQRPVVDNDRCRLCGECWRYCPAQAISHDSSSIEFDYDKCIRCYCCIEVCPHGALTAKETLTGAVIRRVLKIT